MTRRELAALTAPDAEAGVIHALLKGEAIPDLPDPAQTFTVYRFRVVFEVIRDLRAEGDAAEPVTAARRLQDRGLLDAAGGVTGISALTLPEAWAGTAETCACILRETARRRELAEAGERLARAASTPGGDPEAALLEAAALANPAATERRRGLRVEDVPPIWSFEVQTQYLVAELLAEASVTLLSGDSGAGKSTLALSIAGAVAHGRPWAGRAARQCRVLYLDRENPLHVVKERLSRMGIAQTQALTVWGGWVDPGPPAPAVPDVLRWARENRALIIVDSLVAFHDGSEQDASETRRFLNQVRRLANLGATVLLIHHTGKCETAKEYRGSSDIKASVDAAYLLQPLGGDGSKLERLKLKPFKGRFAPLSPILLEYVAGAGFQAIHDTAMAQREAASDVVQAIVRDFPGCSREHVLAEARRRGVSRDDAREALTSAEKEGRLTVETGDRGRKIYTPAGGGWNEI